MDEDDVALRFRKIAEEALSWEITNEQLSSLQSVQGLITKKKHSNKDHSHKFLLTIPVIFSLFAAVLLLQWPVSRYQIFQAWFSFNEMDLESEVCLFESSEVIRDVTRPPVDCAICRNVTEVEKVSQLSPDEFEERFAYSGRPVVITDATDGWKATESFSFSFFKEMYGDDSPVLYNLELNCQFFPYKTDFKSLGEVFQMGEERATMKDGAKPWYIGWSNCDSSAANILREFYERPYFLPFLAESSRTDWIFMGSPGYGAHMHIDNVGDPSWQAQITGEKLWTLEPPPECYMECVNQLKVTVKPGEIIVLDTNRWFHSTLITSDTMSITIGSEYT